MGSCCESLSHDHESDHELFHRVKKIFGFCKTRDGHAPVMVVTDIIQEASRVLPMFKKHVLRHVEKQVLGGNESGR